ncbi:helix-turn-helix domain-containing protein [Streptomyces cyaneofuscatus]|uniref:helix-turn-helix domain-containing protein n=1 Tax=Streptomyces cyaneofuscatus TaxID=66883 RepID=UPI0037B222A8
MQCADVARTDLVGASVQVAAVSCFARKGFYETTTHEIAERVGISQPYLYPNRASTSPRTCGRRPGRGSTRPTRVGGRPPR